MCIFAFFQAANDCMRKILGLLCCILCSGPILVIVGIVMLVTPNDRAERVDAYNRAVAHFNTAGISDWATGGTIGGQSVSTVTEPVPMSWGQSGVATDGQSVYAANTQPNSASISQTYALNTVTSFTRSITKSRTQTTSIRCGSSSGGRSGSGCSAASMSSKCVSEYGGTYSGGSCSSGDSCGPCFYSVHLSQYCAVAARTTTTGNTWAEATSIKSCFYPFSEASQKYTISQGSFGMRLMDSTDPFIELERGTKGTGDFGLTAEQQRIIGIVMLVVGFIIIAALALILFLVVRTVMNVAGGGNSSSNSVPAAGAIGDGNVMPVQSVPVQYPQQQSDYSAPVGSYGAPPPQGGYGQPVQGYPLQQQYPLPQGGGYPAAQGAVYPPAAGAGYPPAQGAAGYPPAQAAGYPPAAGAGYPPAQGAGGYPPPPGGHGAGYPLGQQPDYTVGKLY